MRGLSSHNFTSKKWQPPYAGRFCYLTASDEGWASALGLGEYIDVRVGGLYDVRDTAERIIGYTRHDPMQVQGPYFRVPLRSSRGLFPMRCQAAVSETASFQVLTIRVEPYYVSGERFLTWVIDPDDGPNLIQAGFIECLGDDNINDFSHRVYRENMKRWR